MFPHGNLADALGRGNRLSLGDQFGVIGRRHIGEALAEGLEVGTDQRVGHQVDMVADDHQVARLEGGVQAAGGIRHEKELDAQ